MPTRPLQSPTPAGQGRALARHMQGLPPGAPRTDASALRTDGTQGTPKVCASPSEHQGRGLLLRTHRPPCPPPTSISHVSANRPLSPVPQNTKLISMRPWGAIAIAAPSLDQAGTSSLHQSEFHYKAKQVTVYYALSTSLVLKRRGAPCQRSTRDSVRCQRSSPRGGTERSASERDPEGRLSASAHRQGRAARKQAGHLVQNTPTE